MGEVVMISEEMMVEDMKTKDDGSSEVVRWEKLLPSMALRVMLVEADDSTRQIIAALLRKCSYRVAAVPDGLTAWETLKSRPHSFDLILTEVELPSISGYALLTLVMEHDICKNIPVIMMSSNDSISMVLKCMLKGAADFLIKPIRRNELRNLWQHVWRRQTLTSRHTYRNFHKVEGTSENDAASNHSSDCATSTLKKESSGKGSDTQGTSQLNYKGISNQSNRGGSKYEECLELDVKSVTAESTIREGLNSLEPEGMPCTGTHYPAALRLREDQICPKSPFQDARVRPDKDMAYANISHDHSNMFEPSNEAIDLIGTFDNGPKETHGNSSLNEKFEFSTQLELSLKRFCSSSSKYQGVDERHALNHSNASAFTRYNNKTLQSFCPMSTTNSTEFIEASKSPELSANKKSQAICGAERSGGQETMTSLAIGQTGKTELVYPRPQHGRIPMSGLRHDNSSCGHVFSPVHHTQSDTPSACSPKLSSRRELSPIPTRTSAHSNPEIYESEKHSDEAANTPIGQNAHSQGNTEMVDGPTLGSRNAGQSTGNSFFNGNVNHNIGSAYGSFCSTNDGNGKSVAAADRTMVTESLNDSGSYGLRGMDPHRFIQREAALTKFRLKRKERCFEKKVRYQSRKRLAEQRPRVKGQFVRHVQNDVSDG